MADHTPQKYNVGFDARLNWNEVIGHTLEDVRLNRISGQYQGWLNSVWMLFDMGRTFIDDKKSSAIKEDIEKAQLLIWRYESSQRFNDIKSNSARKLICFEIQKHLSDAQVEVTRAMAEKGMISPLKVPLAEWDEQDIADSMGL